MEKVEPIDGDEEAGSYFTSKVGGKPVWPDLRRLPAHLNCEKCGKPLTLLLQFHAPLTSVHPEHHEEDSQDPRTLFVFMCKSMQCHSQGDAHCFKVLRYEGGEGSEGDVKNGIAASTAACQTDSEEGLLTVPSAAVPSSGCLSACSSGELAEDMAHLNCDKDREVSSNGVPVKSGEELKDSHSESPGEALPLCVVCGNHGPKKCGGCKKVSYCSRAHQLHDWRLGHRAACSELAQAPSASPALPPRYDPSLGVLLPEWDVVTEPEPEACWKGLGERSEEERMAEYRRYVREKGVSGEGAGLSPETLERAAGEMREGKKGDKVFRTFMKRIAPERQQVSVQRPQGSGFRVQSSNSPPVRTKKWD